MNHYISEFLNALSPGKFEGMILYACGAITSTVLKLHFRKEWSHGLKGDNGRWDAPEILLAIMFAFFDHLFMASMFLGFTMPDVAWIALLLLFLYGFTQRWGLEWLGSFKGNTIIKSSVEKTTQSQTIKKDEETIN